MPIEFRCKQCGRMLRTPDETAGQRAKCPACGSIQPIPTPGAVDESQAAGEVASPREAAGTEPHAARPPVPPPIGSEPPPTDDNSLATTLPHPRQSDSEAQEPGSPFSVASGPGEVAPSDIDNPFRAPAHESVDIRPTFRPESLEPVRTKFGEVMGDAWSVYSTHLGTCLLIGLLIIVLQTIASMIVMGTVFGVAAAGQGLNQPEALLIVLVVFGVLVFAVFMSWIYIGQTLFLLKLARGELASFGVFFSGGRYVLPVVAASILWSLLSTLGLAAFIVPGVILYLMFSQFYMVMIDRDTGIIESLTLSARITRGNKVTLLLLVLMMMGMAIVAVLVPCGIGRIFLTPLVALLWIAAYLRMTGQSTIRSVPAMEVS